MKHKMFCKKAFLTNYAANWHFQHLACTMDQSFQQKHRIQPSLHVTIIMDHESQLTGIAAHLSGYCEARAARAAGIICVAERAFWPPCLLPRSLSFFPCQNHCLQK